MSFVFRLGGDRSLEVVGTPVTPGGEEFRRSGEYRWPDGSTVRGDLLNRAVSPLGDFVLPARGEVARPAAASERQRQPGPQHPPGEPDHAGPTGSAGPDGRGARPRGRADRRDETAAAD